MARRVTRWTWGEGLQHLSCEGVAATTPTLPAEGWSGRKFCLQEASLTSPSSYLRPSDKPFQSFVAYSNNEHLFCSWICHEGVSWQVLLSSLWTSAERACVGLEDPSIKWLTHHPWQVVRGCQPGTQPQREARGFPPTLGGWVVQKALSHVQGFLWPSLGSPWHSALVFKKVIRTSPHPKGEELDSIFNSLQNLSLQNVYLSVRLSVLSLLYRLMVLVSLSFRQVNLAWYIQELFWCFCWSFLPTVT